MVNTILLDTHEAEAGGRGEERGYWVGFTNSRSVWATWQDPASKKAGDKFSGIALAEHP